MGQGANRRSWRRIGRRRSYVYEPPPPPVYSWRWIFAYVYYGLLYILIIAAPIVIGHTARGLNVFVSPSRDLVIDFYKETESHYPPLKPQLAFKSGHGYELPFTPIFVELDKSGNASVNKFPVSIDEIRVKIEWVIAEAAMEAYSS